MCQLHYFDILGLGLVIWKQIVVVLLPSFIDLSPLLHPLGHLLSDQSGFLRFGSIFIFKIEPVFNYHNSFFFQIWLIVFEMCICFFIYSARELKITSLFVFKLGVADPDFDVLGDSEQSFVEGADFTIFSSLPAVLDFEVDVCFPDTFGHVELLLGCGNLVYLPGSFNLAQRGLKLSILGPCLCHEAEHLYLPLIYFPTSLNLTKLKLKIAVEAKDLLPRAPTQRLPEQLPCTCKILPTQQKLSIEDPNL